MLILMERFCRSTNDVLTRLRSGLPVTTFISPAAKAGLKAGDILVQFGDKPIKNLYDFTDALRRSKVGDVVEVKVLRDGQPVTASVKLEQRK
jgi:predicted metalloprotease with PDZ domain